MLEITEYITMCNFGGRINKAKKPISKRVKLEAMYRRSRGKVRVEPLSTFTNFSLFFTAGRFEIFTGQVQA